MKENKNKEEVKERKNMIRMGRRGKEEGVRRGDGGSMKKGRRRQKGEERT
jgi:hypothetical protein